MPKTDVLKDGKDMLMDFVHVPLPESGERSPNYIDDEGTIGDEIVAYRLSNKSGNGLAKEYQLLLERVENDFPDRLAYVRDGSFSRGWLVIGVR